MKTKTKIVLLLVLSGIVITGCTFSSNTTGHQPNILLIYTDDHAQWAVGVYGNR